MEQEPRTLWDYGMKGTRQPLPLVPTPEIQAPPPSLFTSFHGPKEKGESEEVPFTHAPSGFPVLLF